jgi:dihydroxy-acid dehydratase
MSERKKSPSDLRSHRYFGRGPFSFEFRQRTLQQGYELSEFVGRPVIAVVNTWSEMNTCHAHLRERAQVVKRGVWQAGGFPVEIPAMSLGEIMMRPTTMLYRNLLAMETEELLRSHPIDGAVLLGGCDKTTPALLMGAITMNLPTIYVPAGAMLAGLWKNKRLGSGTDSFHYARELMSSRIGYDDFLEIEQGMSRSPGTCNTMGTASTMTSIAEVLGFSLPGASSVPAVDALGSRLAAQAGRRIVEMVWEDLKPSDLLTEAAFQNAVATSLALGGSTNAVIHTLALARRAGVALELDAFDRAAREIPVLANLRPSGAYLMEDLHRAGGLPALLGRLAERLHLDAPTCTGRTLGENIAGAGVHDDDVIGTLGSPIKKEALAVLRGNLAPDGCVIKPSAATPELLRHTGRAVVFESANEMEEKIHDPALDVDETSILVLKNAGPRGGPGMPEWGMLPIPYKLLQRGVKDIVRISDARMSGTSYGTCVLHVSPEAFVGGPLSLVQSGDVIELDVPARSITLRVDDAELGRRRAACPPAKPRFLRGYGDMFSRHVTQAHEGCDFDFLLGPNTTPEPEIHF